MIAKDVISGVVQNSFNSKKNAENIMHVLGLDTRLLRGAAPVDDEVPPNGVTGLSAAPIYAGVRLDWDLPPAEDVVRWAKVEITPPNEESYTQDTTDVDRTTIFGLSKANPYSFRVMLVDEWGRESGWSTVVQATPITTAESDIDLAYKQAQGTLQGLIEAINLAGPTAEDGIRGTSLAATQANNMLPLIESDLEMWNNTSLWPPSDAKLADGTRLISSDEPPGHILSLTRHLGRWKLKHERQTPSTNFAVPVTQWREERRATGGQLYIAQATVTAPPGTTVSIALQSASNPAGDNMAVAGEKTVTLGGGTAKIFVSAMGDEVKPYLRIRLGLHTDNTTVYWHKFMLEEARPGATEPSPWNAGILATGSVAAHTLTALTANIADAVIEDAAIKHAKIGSVKADSIITGELKANLITTMGSLQAAGAVMDSRGIYLRSQETNPDGNDGANGFPTAPNVGDWITSNPDSGGVPRPHSGIGFFDDVNDPRRGILIRSRGVTSSNKDGFISIGATSGGASLTPESSAYVNIRAAKPGQKGSVSIGHLLVVDGTINLPPNAVNSDEIAGLDVAKLNGGADSQGRPLGHSINPTILPEIQRLRGTLSYSALSNKPDLSVFITNSELAKKNFATVGQLGAKTSFQEVRNIVTAMVKPGSLK